MEEIHSLTTTDPAVISSSMTATAAAAPAIASVDSGPVLAYAKLEGQEYCYYIRTLQVTLGRQVAKPGTVDIPLGNARSVSRHHARLFYNFATQRFELMVFGKNGAFVNERFVEKGVTVPLENRTKIKIGDSTFLFLLPRIKSIDHQHRPSMRTTPEPVTSHHEKDADVDGDNTSNKDTKPPFSYATLITQAINSNQDKRMALHEIYNYITNHYPYYQMAQNGWQNSIRHNLSLNKAFVKVPRSDTEPGKGAFWTIDPKADMEFLLGTANSNVNGSINNPNKRPNSTVTGCGNSSGEASENPTGETTAVVVTSPVSTSSNKVSERKRAKKEHKSSSLPSLSDTASAATVVEALPSMGVLEEPATALLPSSATSPSSQPSSQPTSQKQIPPAAAVTSQAQIQLQLQATIRQHLLDPVRNPLPPSIAQLLPQAIAQLPPHLAMQFSSTLQSALRAHQQTNQDPPAAAAPGLVTTSDAVSSNATTITTTAAAAAASVTVPSSDTAPSAPSSPPSQQQSLSNP